VWTDPTGNYNEAGHYYTTYYIARSVGYSHDRAQELAFFSQVPDEVGRFDAIPAQSAKVRSDIGFGDKNVAKTNRTNIQGGTHALTGGNAVIEGQRAKNIILDNINDDAVTGIAIHRLADTYAHRVIGKNDRSPNAELYDEGIGHLFDGTSPDEIHRRPELYLGYTKDLANTLAKRLHGNDQDAIDKAVKTAMGEAKQYAELTVELAEKNTHDVIRKGEKTGKRRTYNSIVSDKTIGGFRQRIINTWGNDTEGGKSLAEPEANDIPHLYANEVRDDIEGFVNTIPLDKVGNVDRSEQFEDDVIAAEKRYSEQYQNEQ
jgi:hypothetical protein